MFFFRYTAHLILILYSVTHITYAGFPAGTIIQTPDNNNMPIELLTPGDHTIHYSLYHTYSGIITATRSHNTQQLICVHLPETYIIMDTGQWVYLADKNQWSRADQLSPGQQVLTIDHNMIPIEDITYDVAPTIVYDIEVQPHHTYCVSKENIVVHNPAITVPVLSWGVGSVAWFPGVNLAALGISAGVAGGIYLTKKFCKKKRINCTEDTNIVIDEQKPQQQATLIKEPYTPQTQAPLDFSDPNIENPSAQYKPTMTTDMFTPEGGVYITSCSLFDAPAQTDHPDLTRGKNKRKSTTCCDNPNPNNRNERSCPCPLACGCNTNCKCRSFNREDLYTYKNGTYEGASYHHHNSKNHKSPAPIDGQAALDNSVPVNNTRRIAICFNEFVILDQTHSGVFHGHVRAWEDLDDNMQKILRKAGLVNKKGKIQYAAECPLCN